jgi:hypothetical protein
MAPWIIYAEKNRRHVEDMLSSVGYHFRIGTNFSAFGLMMSFIKGEPYFESVVNERDSKRIINVSYYEHLLKSLSFDVNIFFHGEYYDATFNIITGNFILLKKTRFKLMPISARISRRNFTYLSYKAINKE